MPFNQWSGQKAQLKIGSLYNIKNREFSAQRFVYQTFENFSAIRGRRANYVMSAEAIENRYIQLQDATQNQDIYSADEAVAAGYVMTELPLFNKVRFAGGVRVENNQFSIESRNERVNHLRRLLMH